MKWLSEITVFQADVLPITPILSSFYYYNCLCSIYMHFSYNSFWIFISHIYSNVKIIEYNIKIHAREDI